MASKNRSWKQCREGEHLIFGTILFAERDTPKSIHGKVTVRCPSHVGEYEVHLEEIIRVLGRELKPGDGWNLFIHETSNGQILTERLYINNRKIYPIEQRGGGINHVVHRISRMYVPYVPQGAQASFNFMNPWEDGFNWRQVRYHE